MGKTVTNLLRGIENGDEAALPALFSLVYDELHRIAKARMRREPADHTWQPTALVHEVFLRLVKEKSLKVTDRGHFFSLAARVMRQLLVNHAVAKGADKRGGGQFRVTFDERIGNAEVGLAELLALDRVLEKLSAFDERRARIVELRYFTGLSIEETGEALGISTATVKREWASARLWLFNAIKEEENDAGS